jgi:hypothetical protein
MKKQTKTILLVIAGVIAVVIVVGIVTAVVLFRSAIDSTQTDQSGADGAFGAALTPFAGQQPLLEIRQGEVVVTRSIPAEAPAQPVATLRVLAWEPAENSLTRFQLPMWVVRMSDDPIAMQVGENVTVRGGTTLRPEDIEKFGPILLVDHKEPDGSRVVMWTE